MSYNDGYHATAHVWNINSEGFDAAMEAAEACEGGLYTEHGQENFGWIAIEDVGSSSFNGISYETGITSNSVIGHDDGCYQVSYQNSYLKKPLTFVSWRGTDGGDGGWYIGCNRNLTDYGFHMEEDLFSDNERSHTETVGGYSVWSEGFATLIN